MNGFRVCRKFAERARNSIDLRSEINFYSSSLNPPIIEEEEGKKKKRKNESTCEFIIPRWIDFAKSSWIVKISLLLDEIPLWNQSQLNQTYFITQLPYPFGIGLPKSEIRQEDQNLLAAYNHHRERESSKERQGSINRIASCIRSLFNQLPSIFPSNLILRISNHTLHTRRRFIIVFLPRLSIFYEYFYDSMLDFSSLW